MKLGKSMDACPALAEALKTQPRVWKIYDAMPPSHQREYNKWIDEAKKPETQQNRIANALERIEEWGRIKGKK